MYVVFRVNRVVCRFIWLGMLIGPDVHSLVLWHKGSYFFVALKMDSVDMDDSEKIYHRLERSLNAKIRGLK